MAPKGACFLRVVPNLEKKQSCNILAKSTDHGRWVLLFTRRSGRRQRRSTRQVRSSRSRWLDRPLRLLIFGVGEAGWLFAVYSLSLGLCCQDFGLFFENLIEVFIIHSCKWTLLWLTVRRARCVRDVISKNLEEQSLQIEILLLFFFRILLRWIIIEHRASLRCAIPMISDEKMLKHSSKKAVAAASTTTT